MQIATKESRALPSECRCYCREVCRLVQVLMRARRKKKRAWSTKAWPKWPFHQTTLSTPIFFPTLFLLFFSKPRNLFNQFWARFSWRQIDAPFSLYGPRFLFFHCLTALCLAPYSWLEGKSTSYCFHLSFQSFLSLYPSVRPANRLTLWPLLSFKCGLLSDPVDDEMRQDTTTVTPLMSQAVAIMSLHLRLTCVTFWRTERQASWQSAPEG